MSKRDRQGVRTPAGLEQKYGFGSVFKTQDQENAKQNSEMDQQRMTMNQFITFASSSIDTLNKNITEINKTLTSLSDKDEELNGIVSQYWQTVYPVGAIFLSISGENPGSLFGGTWVRIEDTFLLASGSSYSAGSTGGEAVHTLTEDEMPSHRHTPASYNTVGSEEGYNRYFSTNLQTASTSVARTEITKTTGGGRYAMTASVSGDISECAYTSNTGGGTAHNNMPPYLAVYVWKRTA